MIKVAIVENDETLLFALQLTINANPGFTCDHIYRNGESALKNIPLVKPDIILMDINLGNGINGIDCITQLKPLVPNSLFMVLTIYEDYQQVYDALTAGALGYIVKSSNPKEIINSITDLYEGGAPMSPKIARKVAEQFGRVPQKKIADDYLLTKREKEVLDLISKGKIEKEVAAELYLSLKTVKTHITNIYQKLQVHTRVEALNKYYGR